MECFVLLGKLCSLVYISGIPANFSRYLDQVDHKARSLLAALQKCDDTYKRRRSQTLKAHLSLHLKEDIQRFGTPVHQETERGEQYNKVIREALFLQIASFQVEMSRAALGRLQCWNLSSMEVSGALVISKLLAISPYFNPKTFEWQVPKYRHTADIPRIKASSLGQQSLLKTTANKW